VCCCRIVQSRFFQHHSESETSTGNLASALSCTHHMMWKNTDYGVFGSQIGWKLVWAVVHFSQYFFSLTQPWMMQNMSTAYIVHTVVPSYNRKVIVGFVVYFVWLTVRKLLKLKSLEPWQFSHTLCQYSTQHIEWLISHSLCSHDGIQQTLHCCVYTRNITEIHLGILAVFMWKFVYSKVMLDYWVTKMVYQ
jgi:hypothetical protein